MNKNPLADWVALRDVPRLVELETGKRPSRQTIYNWAKKGWLKVGDYKPWRTTRAWILECLTDHFKR